MDGVTSDGEVITVPAVVVCAAGDVDTGAIAVGEVSGARVDDCAAAVVDAMAGVGEYAAAVVVSTTVGVVDRIAATDTSNCRSLLFILDFTVVLTPTYYTIGFVTIP